MSEFSFEDIKRWMALAYNRDCSIQKAIYYDLFFACQLDDKKLSRADKYFRAYMKEKLDYVEQKADEP